MDYIKILTKISLARHAKLKNKEKNKKNSTMRRTVDDEFLFFTH